MRRSPPPSDISRRYRSTSGRLPVGRERGRGEMAYAAGLGPVGGDTVGVRIPPPAPKGGTVSDGPRDITGFLYEIGLLKRYRRTGWSLAGVPEPERPVLVQQFVPNDGMDLKLYVVRSEVFGVRKPSPLLRERGPGERCAVNESVRKIALRCGELFNLSLYGVDLVEGPDGPVVVDVNYFPSYRTIPGAAALIADRIDLMLRTTGGTQNGRGRPQTDDGYGWRRPFGEAVFPYDRGALVSLALPQYS